MFQSLTNRLSKNLIIAVSIVLILVGFRLRSRPRYGNPGTSASEVARNVPDFPTILQGLTQKPFQTNGMTGHTESLVREIQIHYINRTRVVSI